MKITIEINDNGFREDPAKFQAFFNRLVCDMAGEVSIDTARLYGRYEMDTPLRVQRGFCTLDIEDNKEG